jgi:DNA helicase II / ATP-dependent DNA helicase PcrA
MPPTTDEEFLSGLNPAQREAVLHAEGSLLVLAGAGSGKTRVLTTRIARLIAHHGVEPSRILAVTFTNKAAGEMRERIAALLGAEPAGMWAGTFHAIGARILRMNASLVGRTSGFTIYDQDDSTAVVKRLMERHSISPKQVAPRLVQALISDAKNSLTSPSEYTSLARDTASRAAAIVYPALEAELRKGNAVDFDDLLVLPVRLLEEHQSVRESLSRRFRFVLVDEYQDTNRAQYRLVRLLGATHGNVCVVGDDDQSIYGWRGADIRNILDFTRDFPNAAVARLEENYRSTPPILVLANQIISANQGRMGKTLRPTIQGGEPATLVRTLDERDEAEWAIEELAARRAASTDLALRDFAILYRTNAQSRAFEEALRRRAMPYRLVGAVRFYDRREVRDLMSYLKLIANPADDEAFRRAIAVPRRGIGEATVDAVGDRARAEGMPILEVARRPELLSGLRPAARSALAEFAALIDRLRMRAQEASVDELLRELIEAVRYGDYLRAEGEDTAHERLDNIRELITSAAETVVDEEGEVGLTPLEHFLQRASLVASVDAFDSDADAVTLLTLHNAKGLEFPVVFIAGLEDGLFPLAKAYDDPKLLEEERRLFYVGITRARRKLFLSHAEQRRRNGELMPAGASSFLRDIPEGMLEKRSTIRVRSSGRGILSGLSSLSGGRGSWASRKGSREDFGWGATFDDDVGLRVSAAARRPGRPVVAPETHIGDESQVAALMAIGARVRHRKFGAGTVAELSGSGREAKVKVDFDDDAIGRKTLVVAQANLERETD